MSLSGLFKVGLTVSACALLLASCNATAPLDASGNEIYDAIGNMDLSARPPTSPFDKATGSASLPKLQSGISYIGAGGSTADGGGTGGSGGGAAGASGETGGYQVDYEDAPIASVAKSIIVDALGLGLAVDPRVDGRVSISSARPLTRNQLLFAFENALRANNASLLKDSAGYRIVPASETAGVAPLDRSRNPEPGAGISVMPLRFITSENLAKLLDGFATKPGAVRFDATRNVLMIQGTSEERRQALETALAFDQDWMRGQSVGVYPVSNAAPETLIAELQRIMDTGDGGAYKGFLQFQPVARMNAILVVARKPDALRAAATWIRRLDRSDSAASVSHVYKVKFGDARRLAALLNSSFGGGGGGSSSDGLGSTEPGSDRLSFGSGGNQSGGQTGGFGATGAGGGAPSPGGSNAGGSFGASPFGSLPGRAGASGGAQQASLGGGGAFGGGALGGSDFGQSGGKTAGSGLGSDSASGGASGGGGKVRIAADVSTNTLLIYADRQNYRMIEDALRKLDRPALQVAIEATIAEVTLNDQLQYGVQYFLQNSKGSVGLTSQSATSVLSQVLPGANFVLGPQANPRVILSALQGKTHVKVLSNPSVVVLDNQVAAIQVGDQVPVQTNAISTTTAGAAQAGVVTSNNIEYRPTGVILRVLPRVSGNGGVTMEIEQEISNVANTNTANTLTPTISERHIRSSVSVASGQTVVLGGLVSDNDTVTRTGLPILSNIAFLGDLFAQNQTALNRTELVIFIRPQIITDAYDAQAVAEEMRSKMLYQKPFRR